MRLKAQDSSDFRRCAHPNNGRAAPVSPLLGGGTLDPWPIDWATRPARTSSSTATTRCTGSPGAKRRCGRRTSATCPILLSVGYSACHWCHVMERESFEDETTAAFMNEHFVNVKVDREERPDVDALYMEAVQSMTGQGGWPMTVFCDPEGVPFYGGTYFPPEPRHGMPSFRQVMQAVDSAFRERREEIRAARPADPRPARARSASCSPAARRRSLPHCRATPSAPSSPGPTRSAAASAGRRSSRPPPPSSSCSGAAAMTGAEGRRAHARPHGRGRDLRPRRRRLCPLLGRRRVARAPLREDALRQRPARPLLPARMAGPRPRALPPGLRGDARLGAAGDARPRGRLLLGPRRGLRGRGGALLRLGRSRAARSCWATTPRR